jgi:hypothetical protein
MNKLINNINNWIDNGPQGNDKQLDPITLGLMAAGAYANYRAAKKRGEEMETKPIGPAEIRGHLSPMQGVINQMQGQHGKMMGLSEQMMDPGSSYNLQQKGMMQEQGADQMALQTILQNRQNAATGVDSGIMQAQRRAQQQQLSQSLGQQFQNQMMQNRTQGLGLMGNANTLLGNIGSMTTGLSENIGQAAISQRQHQMAEEMRRKEAEAAMYEGFGNMAMGGAKAYYGMQNPSYNPTNTTGTGGN